MTKLSFSFTISSIFYALRPVATRKVEKMPDKLLKIDELAAALGGIGRASIYRHIKTLPGFPQPVKIGSATRFRESDVQAYIAAAPVEAFSGGKEATNA